MYWLLLVIKMVTVTVNMSDNLANLGKLPKEMIKKGLQDTSKELIRNLMINSPVREGLLKSWFVESETDTEIVIKSPAFYAKWVNYGHPQQPGRFIPGHWNGDRFEYEPDAKVGMVLKASYVEGQHFVEDSIDATMPRIQEFFTINTGG